MKIPWWVQKNLIRVAFFGSIFFLVWACEPSLKPVSQPKNDTAVVEQQVENIAKQYNSVAIKRLSKTDCGKSKSTMRELYGVRDFVVVLGDVKNKRKYNATYYYISDTGIKNFKHVSTWYRPRQNPDAQRVNDEKRLYYGANNPVMKKAQPGDIMLLIRLDEDNIEIRIFDQHYKNINKDLSNYDLQVSLNDDDVSDETVAANSEQEFAFDFPADEFDETDFRLFKSKHTKRKWVIGHITKITDGDTWKIDDFITIRSVGMDAPEKKQTCKDAKGQEYACGSAATAHVTELLKGKLIKCELFGTGRFGRTLAVCYNAKGVNVNKQMVRDGHAVVSVYPPVVYKDDEDYAKSKNIGVWQGKVHHPHCWRHRKKNDGKVPGLCDGDKTYNGWDNKFLIKNK